MKKTLGILALLFAAVIIFSAPVLAATGDVVIDDTTVNLIYGLITGAVAVPIIQAIKKKLNWSGFLAYVLTFAIDAIATAGYFGYMLVFKHQAWNWLLFGAYAVAVFVYDKFGYKLSKLLGMIKPADTPASS